MMMDKARFEPPVYVAAGPGLIREINTPAEALDFLEEWPDEDRGFVYDMVAEACRKAHDLLRPAETARKAFVRWARDNGILEDIAVPPWIVAKTRAGRGGIPI